MTDKNRRYAIIGNSGSGKSTLARRLAEEYGLPMLDLDTVAWEPGKVAVARDPDQARRDVQAFCDSAGGWVVEGCYAQLIEASLGYAPELIFLDPGEATCLAHCRVRPWEPHKYASRDEQDKMLPFLLDWVRAYYTRSDEMSHGAHWALFAAYAGPKRHATQP